MGNKDKKSIKPVCRLILILISVAVVLPAMATFLYAQENGEGMSGKVSVNEDRFCSNELTAENATVTVNEDGTVRVSGVSPKISMTVDPMKAETKANALRIVMKTSSDFDTMNVEYIYKNSAQISVPGEASVTIKKSDVAVEYIVPVAYADSMTHLVLAFNETESSYGSVDVVSIAPISYFYDNRNYSGVVTENCYDLETGLAEFVGSISYETTLENPDGEVVLYRLEQDETIDDISFVHSRVASSPMTLSFKFSWEIKDTSDICSRYFVAILTKNNKIIPLTPETYLKDKVKNDFVDEEKNANAFKGIETTLYAGAAENGTSVAFVDIYLNRLENKRGDGYQYVLDEGKEYYFDRFYVAELDAVMKSYSLSGTSVYLRFLVDSYDGSLGYIKNIENANASKYFAVNPCSDEIIDNIYACSDFVVSRYSGEEFGSLEGVVLGRSLNNANMYNYCDVMPMSDYADMLARFYSIVRKTLDKNNAELEILLPMSDASVGVNVVIDPCLRDKHYPSDLLSKSVVGAINNYGLDVSRLYFVLESENIPSCIKETEGDSGDFIGADNCHMFVETIKALSNEYEGLPADITFCWFPNAEISYYELLASYMYNYNVLACSSGIRNYIISIFERIEEYTSGTESSVVEKNLFSLIKNTYKYADTYNNENVSVTALAATGKKSWNEVVKDYALEKTVKRNLSEQEAEYIIPDNVKGTYEMWNFATVNGSNGWNQYNGCSSLSIYTPSEGIPRSLVATFDSDLMILNGSDYGSIVYKPSEVLLVKNISNISFKLTVPTFSDEINVEEMFEVKITVCSGDVTEETTGVIKSNVETDIYSNISNINEIEYIKIGLRSLDGKDLSDVKMCLNSVSIHSIVYNDRELEDIVVSGELTGDDDFLAAELDALVILGIVTGSCAFVVLVCWLSFALHNKKRNR